MISKETKDGLAVIVASFLERGLPGDDADGRNILADLMEGVLEETSPRLFLRDLDYRLMEYLTEYYWLADTDLSEFVEAIHDFRSRVTYCLADDYKEEWLQEIHGRGDLYGTARG